MEIGYINGDKVYVFRGPHHLFLNNRLEKYDKVQIIKHRDLIRVLNKLFKKAECADTREREEPLGIWFKMACLVSNVADYRGELSLPIDIKDENSITFDNPQMIKKTIGARLHAAKCVDPGTTGLKVIDGLLHTPTAPKGLDDGLSDDFRAFLYQGRDRK